MANPRIEEVEDDDDFSDPGEMDLDAFDFARPQTGSLAPSNMDAAESQISPDFLQQMLGGTSPQAFQQNQQQMPQMGSQDREQQQREQLQKSKKFQCIYPVYFDAARTREEGRRVKKDDAVRNPLAREIVDALQHVGNTMSIPLHVVFEPAKCHPKDWANPGRVRVLIKRDGKPVHPKIANKHHLYKFVADYLKAHPTTEDSPMRLRIQGMPLPKDKIPAPAVPRGFKIGDILPLHSPALSGGGVSDNFLKDMMDQMGAGGEGLAGLGGPLAGAAPSVGQQKKVKDKKKK